MWASCKGQYLVWRLSLASFRGLSPAFLALKSSMQENAGLSRPGLAES